MDHVQTVGAVFIAIIAVVSGLSVLVKTASTVVKTFQESIKDYIEENSKPTEELSWAVKELNITLKGIQDDNKENKRVNEKQHDEIFGRLREHGKIIDEHTKELIRIATEHDNNH